MNKEEKTNKHKKSTRGNFPNHHHHNQYHKVLSSLFHTHKQPLSYQDDSGNDERSATDVSPRGSMKEKTKTPPDSLSKPMPLLRPQVKQLLLVQSSSSPSSHVPPRPRSNNSLNPSTISATSTEPSLRSAYSNEDGGANGDIHADQTRPPSLIRSDRLQMYHFGTPTHFYSGGNQYHDHESDAASSQFSYDGQSQSHSSSSRYNQQQRQKHRSRTPLSYLKRSYFSSSFASSNRRKSMASQSGGADTTRSTPFNTTTATSSSLSSSSVRRRTLGHRGSHILFLGRRLPDFETLVYCSDCEKWIQSRLRYRNGAMVWLAAFVLLMCTVFLFWIPFYTKYFKDTVHYCPSCHCEIGRHSVL